MKLDNIMARLLIVDIETSPIISYNWGIYEQDAIEVVEDWQILCFAYKWLGERSVYVVAQDDFKGYKKGVNNDKHVVEALWSLFDEANVIIGHNSDQFDIKKSNARFMYHNLPPPAPYKRLDTKKIAKKYAAFTSNKLDDLGDTLKLGRKEQTGGFATWKGCMAGDKKSWVKMKKYNCVTINHMLLDNKLRWRTVKTFKKGEKVLGFEEEGRGRTYKEATIESIKFGQQPVYKVTLESGKVFEVTEDHRWLVVNWVHDRVGKYVWKTTGQLNKHRQDGIPRLLNVWEEDSSKEAGWLAGIFDGEGSLYNGKDRNSGSMLTVSQVEGPTLDKIIKLIDGFSKLPARLNNQLHSVNPVRPARSVRIAGCMADRLEFLGKVRPERLIPKVDFNRLGRVEARNGIDMVKSIEPAGVKEIAIIRTSTNTFICDGYPMHNCQDVLLDEKLYLRFLPYIDNHPSVSLMQGLLQNCPKCGGGPMQKRGLTCNKTTTYQQFQCQACRGWSRSRAMEKNNVKPEYVN